MLSFAQFLYEEKKDPNTVHAAVAAGRFSLGVPTVEHHKLIENLLKQKADHHYLVVMGPKSKEETTAKDPFTSQEKQEQLRRLYPPDQYPTLHIVGSDHPHYASPAQAFAKIYHNHKGEAPNVKLSVVAGHGDAGVKGKAQGGSIEAYQEMLDKLNGSKFPERVNERGEKVGGDYRMNYSDVKMVPNTRGTTSGSVVRAAAKDGDHNNPDDVENFRKMLHPDVSSKDARSLMMRVKARNQEIQDRKSGVTPEIPEKRLRQGVKHIKDISYDRMGELIQDGTFKGETTEKTDGSALQVRVRHDAKGRPVFGTRTSTSDWVEEPGGYSKAGKARFGEDFDPTITSHFDRIHNELSNNPNLVNYLTQHAQQNGGESRLRGEIFYKPHGRPAEDGGTRFIGTSYDPNKMGRTGTFVVHSKLPDNAGHDMRVIPQLGDDNFKFDHDKLRGGKMNIDMSDEKRMYDSINPALINSRKKADAVAKAAEKEKFEKIKGSFEQKLRAHADSIKPKWGVPGSTEKEGNVFHPAVGGEIYKTQHSTFTQNKPKDLFNKQEKPDANV